MNKCRHAIKFGSCDECRKEQNARRAHLRCPICYRCMQIERDCMCTEPECYCSDSLDPKEWCPKCRDKAIMKHEAERDHDR